MIRIALFCSLIFLSSFCFSQEPLTISELENVSATKTIEEAIENPDGVIKLELKGKKSRVFIEHLDKFTNLQYISIKRAGLQEIPESITKLGKLQYLDLSNNEIQSIPEKLFELSQLKVLKLGQNEIETISPNIKNLRKLTVLDVWSNNIKSLPKSMTEMEELKYIDLRVILFSQEQQNKIQEMLPGVKIEFSYSCNCN